MSKQAVCFGINDYPGTNADLSGCINDVKDWSVVLGAAGFQVKTFFNGECKKAVMVQEIKHLLTSAKEGDTLVIQYSGHGSFVPDLDGDEPDGVDECLCPHDFQQGMLLDDELNGLFKMKPDGANLLFLSDSCHSGTVARFGPVIDAAGLSHANKIRFLPPSTFLSREALASIGTVRRNFTQTLTSKLLQTKAPALLIAGCQDTEYSLDCYFRGRPNGAFTFFALQALRKMVVGENTYGDWFRELRTLLPTSAYAQSPNMVGTREQTERKIFA
jgi:hypothetical protein